MTLGRPSKLTPAVQMVIVEAVRDGSHPVSAARKAGIAESTFRDWWNDSRARFRHFRAEIEQAEAEAEIEAVSAVRASDKRWWLERRHRERWGKPLEARADAAAVVSLVANSEPERSSGSVQMASFTPDELRVASIAFIDQKRRAAGLPPLGDPAEALKNLIVGDFTDDRPDLTAVDDEG